MFKKLLALWYRRQRRLDIDILWPAIKKTAEERGSTIEEARQAMLLHCGFNHAWVSVGSEETIRIIENLR